MVFTSRHGSFTDSGDRILLHLDSEIVQLFSPAVLPEEGSPLLLQPLFFFAPRRLLLVRVKTGGMLEA